MKQNIKKTVVKTFNDKLVLYNFQIQRKMSRQYNKYYTIENRNSQDKKFISPTELKHTIKESTKLEENRSEKDKLGTKNVDTQQQKNQKSKLSIHQGRNGTGQGQNRNKISSPHDRQIKFVNSKSKEKKDFMAVNLARFNRSKKQDKRSDSSNSQHSSTKQKQQAQQIYTSKPESRNNQKIGLEYATNIYTKQQSKGQFNQSVQTSSINSVSQNSISLLNGKAVNKPMDISVIKYEQRSSFRKEEARPIKKEVQQPYIKSTISQMQYPRRIVSPQVSRIQQEMKMEYQNKYTEELVQKIASEREEWTFRLRKIQMEKQQLQERNKELLEQQFKMKNEIDLFITKNSQLQFQMKTLRESATRNGQDTVRINRNNENMFKELEERYNLLLQDYRIKTKQNGDFSRTISDLSSAVQVAKAQVRSYQEEIKNRSLQAQKMKKIYEVRLNEVKQDCEFQVKEIKMRSGQRNQNDTHLQASISQLERQLISKNREIQIKNKENQELQMRSKTKQEIQGLLEGKFSENLSLISELNRNKELIMKLNNQISLLVQKYSTETKAREMLIEQLQRKLQHTKNNEQMAKLTNEAHNQLYGNSQQQGSFQEMLRKQSEETNKLRYQIMSNSEQMHRIQGENDEQRERIRRLEQEAQLNSRTYSMNLNNLKEVKDATEMILKKRIAALEARIMV